MAPLKLPVGIRATDDRPLFVGSYTPLSIVIDPESGLTFDDLDLTVPDGLAGGMVSLAKGPGFDPGRPDVMLLAGHTPGSYTVAARDRNTGDLVGELRYEIADRWEEQDDGPPLWFSGRLPVASTGSAWGGGDPNAPQNLDVFPARGTRRVAIVFVDTASQRYTSDLVEMQAHRDRWLNEVVRGAKGADGVERSSAAWFREVSYGAFDLGAEAFGPVQLSGSFTDYFNDDGSFKGSYPQECLTAADGLVDYTRFDTVLLVSQSVPATDTESGRRAWPYASIHAWGPFTTSDGPRNLGIISMPNEWGTTDDREIHETFSHEMGHNLGLWDAYSPVVPGRNVGSWDIMDWDDPLPHLLLVHRMMLGWVSPGWLRRFDFGQNTPVDQTVRLSPVEGGAPAPGTFAGIEVRVADGLNYYLEYRNGESPDIGDRHLPTDDRVLGTDVTSPPQIPPMARPSVLLFRSDGNDSGPVLGNGDFYTETDHSDPLFPMDFRIDVSGIDGTKADVRIRYGVNGRPDPSIRPWPAGPARPWQSPDIEVRNAKSLADPAWFNVPWVGHPNTIAAQITNRGNVNAPAVRVDFYVKNFNIGGAPESYLGSDIRDVNAGATVEFTAGWVPPGTGHFCVVARIPLYVVPTATSVVEQTELNNLAQSNYDRFNTATSSPSTREVTSCTVRNPYQQRTRVFIVAGQTNPLYRTLVEHTWLWLGPGESREVGVMFEYALDPRRDEIPPDVRLRRDDVEEFRRLPNLVGLHTQIEDPAERPRHRLEILGGAQVEVTTGRATRIDPFEPTNREIRGVVVTADSGDRVDGGTVLVTVDREAGRPTAFTYVSAPVRDGVFEAVVPTGWKAVRADFLPPTGYSPSATDWVRARTGG